MITFCKEPAEFVPIVMVPRTPVKNRPRVIVLCTFLLFFLRPFDAFATIDCRPMSPAWGTIIAFIIAFFLPAAIMVAWRRRLDNEVHKGKSLLKEYLTGLLVLNIWAIVFDCIIYSTTSRSLSFYAIDFPSHYAHKLNEVGKFLPIRNLVLQNISTIDMLLYMVGAIVLGFLLPLASKKIEQQAGLRNSNAGFMRKTLSISTFYWSQLRAGLKNLYRRKRRILQDVSITVALAAILFAAGSFKSGYHLDEMLTFGLANNDRELDLDDGTIYDGEYIWHDYLTVPEGGNFDYVNLYVEQAYDCHPPMYYMLIHTVSSLFPSLPVLWIGLLIHVPLACIVFWQLVWIGKKLGIRRLTALVVAASFVAGMGFFNEAIVFFRMYCLLTIWANFLVMVFLHSPAQNKGTSRYYLSFGLVLLGGLLTQYYFVVFACFTCLIYALMVAGYKNWDKLVKSVYTAVCSIVLWLSIYPFALPHILWSTRGSESFDNLASQSLMECFIAYAKLIDADVFGHLLPLLIIAIVGSGVFIIRLYGRGLLKSAQERLAPYLFMIIPFVFYILVIAKVAPYQTLRYVLAGCGILYIALFAMMNNLFRRVHKRLEAVTWACSLIVLAGGYLLNGSPGLRLVENDNIAALSRYENALCLYYYGTEKPNKPHRDKTGVMKMNLLELKHMRKIMIVDGAEWTSTQKIIYTGGPIVVYITNPPNLEVNHEDILNHLKQQYALSASEQLFTYGYSTAYVVK